MNQPARVHIVDAAWQVFSASAADRDFAAAWLYIQCEMVPGAYAGWLFEHDMGEGQHRLIARHRVPSNALLTKSAEALAVAAREKNAGLLEETAEAEGYLLAYPVMHERERQAVVVVAVGSAPHEALTAAMRQLQWGASSLRDWLRRTGTALSPTDASDVFKLFAATVEPKRFTDAATALTAHLAHLWHLDRVSLGMMRGRRLRIASISHIVHTDARMAAIRQIEEAMHEAMDQRTLILVPLRGSDRGFVTKAAETLLAGRPEQSVVAVFPLNAHEQAMGALVLEKSGPLSDEDVRRCDALVTLLGPALAEKRDNDRWLVTKIGASFAEQVGKLLGRAHPVRKLIALSILAVAVAAALVDAPYSVSAPAVIEAEGRRVVPAPYDGYLARVEVRPGDHVRPGDVLATLDDSDMVLERLGLLADREQRRSELQAATAAYDLAKAKMLRAEVDQIEAKLRLAEARLERASLRAPIAGVVLSGDLSQSLGEPMKLGTPMFELAPDGAFRLIVKVDERDIDSIRPGQPGRAVLAALPQTTFSFTVTRVTPVLEANGGRNYYRVEGTLETSDPSLRAGLEGRARIDAGERRLFWIWTHPMIAWARLQLWTWLP